MSRDPARMLQAVVTTLRRQGPYVRTSPVLKEAYKTGMRMWTSLYGDDLARQVGLLVERRDWARALRAVNRLARFHPRGLGHLR